MKRINGGEGSRATVTSNNEGDAGVLSVLSRVSRFIDRVADLNGVLAGVLITYCMIFGVVDVFLRYALNNASLWIGPTLQAAMVLLACTAGVYAFKEGNFVRLDLLYDRLSRRSKAALDLLTCGFGLVFLVVLIWKGKAAVDLALMLNQKTPTVIPIPLAPIKAAIPIAGIFMTVLVIRQIINDIVTLAGLNGAAGDDKAHPVRENYERGEE
jgi:TRAP-type mannitol/chloroaromatic compound transport system permease small subunit